MIDDYMLLEDIIRKLRNPTISEIKHYLELNIFHNVDYRFFYKKNYHFFYNRIKRLVENEKNIIKLNTDKYNRRRYCLSRRLETHYNFIEPIPEIVKYDDTYLKIYDYEAKLFDVRKSKFTKSENYTFLNSGGKTYILNESILLATIYYNNGWKTRLPDVLTKYGTEHKFVTNYFLNKGEKRIISIEGRKRIVGDLYN